MAGVLAVELASGKQGGMAAAREFVRMIGSDGDLSAAAACLQEAAALLHARAAASSSPASPKKGTARSKWVVRAAERADAESAAVRAQAKAATAPATAAKSVAARTAPATATTRAAQVVRWVKSAAQSVEAAEAADSAQLARAARMAARAAAPPQPVQARPPAEAALMQLGGHDISADILMLLQEALCAMPESAPKRSLACTCTKWRQMLRNPAYWRSLQIPTLGGAERVHEYIVAVPRRFERTRSIEVSFENKLRPSKQLVQALNDRLPALVSFSVSCSRVRHGVGDELLELLTETGLASRLRSLRLGPLRLSSRSFPDAWRKFTALEHLELMSLPTDQYKRIETKSRWRDPKLGPHFTVVQGGPVQKVDPERLVAAVVAGCRALRTMRLASAAHAASCAWDSYPLDVDVDAVRAGARGLDQEQYRAHRAGLPPFPADAMERPLGGGRSW